MNRGLLARIASQVTARQGVRFSSTRNIPMKSFSDGAQKLTAIEQNPATDSRWARLAREGHAVVQVKDNTTNKYVAVVVDGKVHEYPQR